MTTTNSVSHRPPSLACAITAVAVLAFVAFDTQAQPPDEQPIEWRNSDAVRSQLQARISVDWEDVTLSQAVATLSQSQRVAIVLDRRVDPTAEFRMAIKSQTLDAVLKGLGIKHKLGVARVWVRSFTSGRAKRPSGCTRSWNFARRTSDACALR